MGGLVVFDLQLKSATHKMANNSDGFIIASGLIRIVEYNEYFENQYVIGIFS